MSVELFTLLLDDPKPVFNRLAQHGGRHVMRQQAVQIAPGWTMKVALHNASMSERFRSQWNDALVTLEPTKADGAYVIGEMLCPLLFIEVSVTVSFPARV